MNLVKNNLIYGLVAIGFLIPAEKLIKKMFGLDGAQTTSGFGSFAGGALAMQGFNKIASAVGKGKTSKELSGKEESSSQSSLPMNNKIRTQNRDFAQSFRGDDNNNQKQLPSVNDENENSSQLSNENNDNNDLGKNENDFYPSLDESDGKFDMSSNSEGNPALNGEQDKFSGVEKQDSQDSIQPKTLQNGTFNKKKGWRRELAKNLTIKGAKSVGKKAYKGIVKRGIRGAGAFGGAMVGLAAGVATGDMSKAVTYASAGAYAGRSIGKAAAELPERGVNTGIQTFNSLKNASEKYQYEKDKAQGGIGHAFEQANIRQNERARKEFLNNKAEKEKYEEMAGRISSKNNGKEVKAEDLMNAAFDYKVAGITDEKQIENGLNMEVEHSDDANIHKNMLDIVSMTNQYGKDYVLDDKKRASMQDTIKSNVKGEKNQDRVWDLYTKTLGFNTEKMGDKYKMQRNIKPVDTKTKNQQIKSSKSGSPSSSNQSGSSESGSK